MTGLHIVASLSAGISQFVGDSLVFLVFLMFLL